MSAPLPRPVSRNTPLIREWIDAATDWLRWRGVGRVLVAGVGCVAAALGGWWLLRSPAPPVESLIPMVTTSTTVGSSVAVTIAAYPDVATVHVAGAVVRPGVYDVPQPARVIDAVTAAGGPTGRAVLDAVNLARPLVDGEQVFIPRRGQTTGGAGNSSPSGAGSSAPAGPVNINVAGADRLQTLPGVGPSTARAIIDHRQRNGPFASIDDLLAVRGIGPTKLEALRGLVTV